MKTLILVLKTSVKKTKKVMKKHVPSGAQIYLSGFTDSIASPTH